MSKKKSSKENTQSPYPIRSRASDRNSQYPPEMSEEQVSNSSSDEEDVLNGLENSSPLTIGLMKHFIKEMEKNITKNINAQIDKKVDSIKEDIGGIKSQLDRSNGIFEEMQTRISNVEDKVQDLNKIELEIVKIRKEWEEALTQINKEACRARKDNIIIQGITNWSKNPDIAMQNFEKLCKENLKMSPEWMDKLDVDEAYHFPPKGGKGEWPLFVALGKSKQRSDIYKAAPNLKGTPFILKNDLAPCLLKVKKNLGDMADKLKAAPYNYQTKFRDSPFEVWLEIKKTNDKEWKKWNGELGPVNT